MTRDDILELVLAVVLVFVSLHHDPFRWMTSRNDIFVVSFLSRMITLDRYNSVLPFLRSFLCSQGFISQLTNSPSHNFYTAMNFNSSIFALLLVGLQTFFPSADAVADNNYASATAAKLAVVRPFSPADVDSLAPSFDVWDEFPPCSANGTVADLFLVYSQSLETSPRAQEAVGRVTDRFHKNNGWGHCFGEIFAVDADIQSDLDIYQPKEQDTNPLWVNGPNRHFERIVRVGQAEGFDTLYLMEGDSVPVKAYWLDSLMLDAELNRPFTILGS